MGAYLKGTIDANPGELKKQVQVLKAETKKYEDLKKDLKERKIPFDTSSSK